MASPPATSVPEMLPAVPSSPGQAVLGEGEADEEPRAASPSVAKPSLPRRPIQLWLDNLFRLLLEDIQTYLQHAGPAKGQPNPDELALEVVQLRSAARLRWKMMGSACCTVHSRTPKGIGTTWACWAYGCSIWNLHRGASERAPGPRAWFTLGKQSPPCATSRCFHACVEKCQPKSAQRVKALAHLLLLETQVSVGQNQLPASSRSPSHGCWQYADHSASIWTDSPLCA